MMCAKIVIDCINNKKSYLLLHAVSAAIIGYVAVSFDKNCLYCFARACHAWN